MAVGAIGGCVVCGTCGHLRGVKGDLSGEEIDLGMFLTPKSGLEQLVAKLSRDTRGCNEGLAEA